MEAPEQDLTTPLPGSFRDYSPLNPSALVATTTEPTPVLRSIMDPLCVGEEMTGANWGMEPQILLPMLPRAP